MDVLVTGAEITHFETDNLSFFIELIMYFFFPLKEILTLRKTKAAKLNPKIHEQCTQFKNLVKPFFPNHVQQNRSEN